MLFMLTEILQSTKATFCCILILIIDVALCTLHIELMLRCARVGRGGVGWPKNVHSPAITHVIL